MTIILERRRSLPDGRTETYTPMKNADGYFILADRAVDPQHNKAANQLRGNLAFQNLAAQVGDTREARRGRWRWYHELFPAAG